MCLSQVNENRAISDSQSGVVPCAISYLAESLVLVQLDFFVVRESFQPFLYLSSFPKASSGKTVSVSAFPAAPLRIGH